MQLNQKLNDKTILFYIEHNTCETNFQTGANEVTSYLLSFQFYDAQYFVTITREDLENDIPMICMEGDSNLFDSFERACEEEHWETIKAACKQYDTWYSDLQKRIEEDVQDMMKEVES